MAAYKGIRTHNERGLSVEDILVIASTYDELFDIEAAVEVNLLDITETSIELKDGATVANSAKFSASENLSLSDNDSDCLLLLLSVLENEDVYIARFINPANPATESDFCFIGTVEKKVTKKDVAWDSDLYATETGAISVYGFSAGSFDSSKLLSKKIEDLVRDSENESTIDTDWKTANVVDRLAYFKHDNSDGFGEREARFANLVSLENVIEYLLSEATESGITIEYISSDTNIFAIPVFYIPVRFNVWKGLGVVLSKLRYCDDNAGLPVAPKPFHLIGGQSVQLKTGGNSAGSPFISLRLIDPNENEKHLSWLSFSLHELLAKIAMCFGSVLRVEYIGTNEIQIKFQTQEEFTATSFLLGDAIDSETDISLSVAESEDEKGFSGVAYLLANEGPQYYVIDSEPKQVFPQFLPPTDGDFLPLTISPTWAFLRERGEDAGINLVDKKGRALLPHNIVFYDNGNPKSVNLEYNLTALHTAIYLQVEGLSDTYGEVGVEGLETYRPIGQIVAKENGAYKYYNELLPFVNNRQKVVSSYLEKTRKISVAGLLHFKENPDSPEDWRNVNVGFTTVIDGENFVCTKITRKKTQTDLELVNKTEFVIDEEPIIEDIEEIPVNAFPISLPIDEARKGVVSYTPKDGESIAKFSFVGLDNDGKIFTMYPTKENYGKQLGFAISGFDYETDNPQKALQIQTRGELFLGENALEDFPFAPNSRLFLKSANPNFSDIPPNETSEENLFLEIGRLSPDGLSIIVDIKSNSAIFENEIPVEIS